MIGCPFRRRSSYEPHSWNLTELMLLGQDKKIIRACTRTVRREGEWGVIQACVEVGEKAAAVGGGGAHLSVPAPKSYPIWGLLLKSCLISGPRQASSVKTRKTVVPHTDSYGRWIFETQLIPRLYWWKKDRSWERSKMGMGLSTVRTLIRRYVSFLPPQHTLTVWPWSHKPAHFLFSVGIGFRPRWNSSRLSFTQNPVIETGGRGRHWPSSRQSWRFIDTSKPGKESTDHSPPCKSTVHTTS